MNVLKIRSEMRNGRESIFDLPLRVTFYARVSTDKDEQLNSLENQVQYYTGVDPEQAELDLRRGIYRRGASAGQVPKSGIVSIG